MAEEGTKSSLGDTGQRAEVHFNFIFYDLSQL